ncbi:MAG: ribosome small subunit-dependent GTPase A [Dehalococcoidia bacterium]
MSHKLTDRQVKSLKKHFQHKEQRQQVGEAQRQRVLDRSLRRGAPPRRKGWDAEDDGYATREKIRRQNALDLPPPAPAAVEQEPSSAALTGTVIEVRSRDSLVSCEGHVVRALLPPGSRLVDPVMRSPLAVGDRVELTPVSRGEARIVHVLPRRSALVRDVSDTSRRDPLHKGQVLAANIDQVIVVCSPAAPPFRPRLIDRYLVAASRDALPVVVCLNKVDLGVSAAVEAYLAGYAGLGVDALRVSALSGAGLDDLRARLEGRVSLLTGHSGVGKSSLLNAVEPGLALRVGTVTEATAGQGKGRHTTSSARLVPLSLPDTFVVDSPGIRAFGIGGVAARELASHFPDIASLAPGCAFHDCLHRREPDCAVATGAARDSFLHERLASYRAMLGELA